jgi:mannose-6-phosphate isomerase-like protein (cupin superfamily)
MISSDEVFAFITQSLPYEQRIVSYIDKNNLQHQANKFSDIPPLNEITLKLEGMEKYSKRIWEHCKLLSMQKMFSGPVSCHLFLAQKGSPSFGRHTDPDDVIIWCTEGIKSLYVEDTKYDLNPGSSVSIPANTPHEIINEHNSVMLSFGFEHYYIDKLV